MRRAPIVLGLLVIGMAGTFGIFSAASGWGRSGAGWPMGAMMGMEHGSGMRMGGHASPSSDPAPTAPSARVVEVTASAFRFEPDRITIQAGEDVAIRLTSTDTTHDFVVEGEDGPVVAVDGGTPRTGGLRIERAGLYAFYCSVPGHRESGMEGTLVVE